MPDDLLINQLKKEIHNKQKDISKVKQSLNDKNKIKIYQVDMDHKKFQNENIL